MESVLEASVRVCTPCFHILQRLWTKFEELVWQARGKLVRMNGKSLRVTSIIGEGGYAYVYRVVSLQNGHVYALKRIITQDADQLSEALREIKAHRQFRHRNIVPVVDSAVQPVPGDPRTNHVLILYPYCGKGTLQDRIDSSKESLSETDVLEMFDDICKAVQVLHRFDPPWSHRDLKPSNILIDDENRPLLTDFGSATKARIVIQNRNEAIAAQEAAAMHTTPYYRAPELFDVPSQCTLTEKIDIWALGCVLYAMAFGKSPFEEQYSQKGASLALAAMEGAVKFPSGHTFSVGFVKLVRDMLSVDPKFRPSVESVMESVGALLRDPASV